jgi:hypothetical protein
MRARRTRRSWSGRAGIALVIAFAALCGSAPIAAGSSPDAQATHAYLTAQYKLSGALLHAAPAVSSAESATAGQIARECRGVFSAMPKPPLTPLIELTPRARGENDRLTQQRQTIEAELITAIVKPRDSLYRPAEEAYAAEVRHLSWADPTIASQIQAATTTKLEDASIPAPSFCADARAWAQSGYRALSTASREFEASREARKKSAPREERPLSTLLEPYENASDRALLRKISAIENKLLAGVGATFRTDFRLRRILGFPDVAKEEPRKPIVLGHGRAAAGTRFVVYSGKSDSPGSCHRSASVFYTRLGDSPEVLIMGGPNNPICLSPPHERHPAVFCEVGLETIQTPVPASVRSVRLVLADRRTIESRVAHVPRRDGGPAGIYAQQIRGSSSHAVSLLELNAGHEVVLALDLPRYRCIKPRHQQELPTSAAELATAHTPGGEPFTISTFGEVNAEPLLSLDTGVDPQLNEPTIGFQAPKAFPWSLSIGCAPHPYAILYGILAPPGKSVTAQTPQGAVALNVIPIAGHLHAKGPLAYGAFATLPSELIVRRSDGSTLYSESLAAKDKEATEFCEGYAEG